MVAERTLQEDIDPLIFAMELGVVIDAAVLDTAIRWRNAQIDKAVEDVNRLGVVRQRLLSRTVHAG